MTPEEVFNDETYLGFDQVRFDNFNELNIDFKNKKILELGSGIGNHTDFLLTKKPKVIVSVEGLKENFDVLEERFKRKKSVFCILHDLENPFTHDWHFDWIYNYGLLYHLKNPFEFVKNLKDINHDNMILETCIEFSGDENILHESNHQSQSLNGIGSRPNLYRLVEELKKIYSIVFYPKQPDHVWFNIHSVPPPILKRIVIICKK